MLEMVIPSYPPFNSLLPPLQKPDRLRLCSATERSTDWWLRLQLLCQVLKVYCNRSNTVYVTNVLANAIFSISINKEEHVRIIFTWKEQNYTFIVLPPGSVNTPVLRHTIVYRAFDYFNIPQHIVLVHYVDKT